VPKTPRENDITLMDYFVTLKLSLKQLKRLNRCRVYLQVLFLSDISSAARTCILPCYRQGRRDPYRKSLLDWPHHPSPPRQDWVLWSQTLHHLEDRDKLSIQLGNWVAPSHQTWSSFIDPSTQIVYVCSKSSWTAYSPIFSLAKHNTRSSLCPWYSLQMPMQTQGPDKQLYPASIVIDQLFHDYMFQISVSKIYIPQVNPIVASGHFLVKEDRIAPHPYYLELLQWDTTSIELHIESVAEAIT
jgi:hypothetical protein